MNQIIKRFASTVAGLAIIFSFTAIPAFADSLESAKDELTDGVFTYELINGTYTLTKCSTSAIADTIPEMRNGYAVTAIADYAFANCTAISSLTIPDTVTSIGVNAFAGCTSLKEIKLPNRITSIPNGSFMGCSLLESIDIPDSVNTIESYSFYKCSVLKDIELPESLSVIEPMAFAECSSIENINADNTKNFVFENGILYNADRTNIYRAVSNLTGDVYIENTVTTIEPGAFSVCAGIENLFLPSSVKTIGEDAFGYCVNLKSIDFSEGLETISPIAFKFCTSLESADMPTTLTEIGEGAFYNCSALSRAVIPEGVETIGNGVFTDCPKLEQISIPKSVVSIGSNAFGFTLDESGNYVLDKSAKMSVYSDSAGAKYAKDNKIDYSTVDKNLKNVAFITIFIGIVIIVIVFAAVLMARGKKGAPMSVRKADKLAKQKEEEDNYKNIVD